MTLPSQSLALVLPVATGKTSGEILYQQQLNQVAAAYTQYGATSARPTTNMFIGRTFFDTTLNALIVWNGTSWTNAVTAGLTVTPSSFIYGNATGHVASSAATSGQLLIGSTGSAPVLGTLTGGTGIGVANGAGTITLTNTGVTTLAAGPGISLSGSSGNVTITNTGSTAGVTSITAGSGITISGPTGNVTINSTGAFNPPMVMMYAAFPI